VAQAQAPRTPEGAPIVRRLEVFDGLRFEVLEVDLRRADLRIHWGRDGRPWRTFRALQDALAAAGSPARAITNAGTFEPGLAPTGLLVSGGRRVHGLEAADGDPALVFFMKPNGVFAIAGGEAVIVETGAAGALRDVAEATQSGPLLVRRGALHPRLRPGSPNRKVRSGIGVRDPARVVIVLSKDESNLETFARLFRDRLGCADALYLDGVISRLWEPGGGEAAPAGEFGGMISVHERR